MRYKAEIFDQLQYLYQETGFNDHQLHCVIKFDNKLNEKVMETAVRRLIKAEPVLSRVYRNFGGNSYWEDIDTEKCTNLFTVVDNEKDFEHFTFSKVEEEIGPQIKVCLFASDKDSLAIIINHMVTDGAGMKKCAYLLSDLYTKILENPNYVPNNTLKENRSFRNVLSTVSLKDRIKVLFLNNKDNNQAVNGKFPMSTQKETVPFILTHEITQERFLKIHSYCKKNKVTINDMMLTIYLRVLSNMLDMAGKTLNIPIMIDMRKYLKEEQQNALTNLSSTVIVSVLIDQGEDFKVTLNKINSQMKAKKENHLGLNTFLKLDLLYKVFKSRFGFQILKKSLKNPIICMTNIGILDTNLLKFKGSPIKNAFVCGSIKYRPHFQMAISSFLNTMTFSVNLYGSQQDQDNIRKFFYLIDGELSQALKEVD